MAQFSAYMKRDGGTSTLAVSGEVDLSNSEKVRELGKLAVDALADTDRVLIIDLTHVALMDTTGIGALVAVNNAARVKGREVRLRGVRPILRRMLEVGGLATVFDLDEVEASGEVIGVADGRKA
jgi:anti-sigma B factor antagonist